MSLMGMNRAFKKHGAIWGGILVIFVVGGIAFTSFGSNSRYNQAAGPNPNNAEPGQNSTKTVATVNGKAVTLPELDERIKNLVQQQAAMNGQPAQIPPPEQMNNLRALVLDKYYKQQAALVEAAKKANIQVSDSDIAAARDKAWEAGRASVAMTLGIKETASDAEIDQAFAAQSTGMTVARLKAERLPDDALRLQVEQEKLLAQFKKEATTSAGTKPSPDDQIQVRHILIKTIQPGSPDKSGLSDAQAKAKAEGLLAQIKADPTKMEALAKSNSDDPGSKDKGGFYDWNTAKTYVPEFSKAALAAGVGKVYPQVVKTNFGYHIIKLEGERPDVDGAAQKKMTDAINAAAPSVKVEISDPGIKAAQLQTEAAALKDPKARDAKLADALTELQKVSKTDDASGAALLQKAALLMEMKRAKDAIAAYEEALTVRNTVETRLALADLYLTDKNAADAKKQLGEAEKLAIPDVSMQYRYATLLEKVGEKDKAKAAQKKAMDMLQAQMSRMQPQVAPSVARTERNVPPAPKPATGASPASTTAAATGASPAPAPSASAAGVASPAPAASPAPVASASPVAAPPGPK